MLILQVSRNAEGGLLATLGVKDEPYSYRIAGPKAWGGARNVATLDVREDDLVKFIKEYCPSIIQKLNG